MNFNYQTIESTSEGLFKDKGSKFFAFAYNVNNTEEIKIHLQNLRKRYFDARHVCYAWKIGELTRVNDDQEPSGTAGKPIFGVITSHELDHILIAVVRYFGGTLLGTGGLIQAYRSAAQESIVNAKLITIERKAIYNIQFPYEIIGEIMRLIKKHHAKIVHRNDSETIEITCEVELRYQKQFEEECKLIRNLQILF